ncbi:hypothetical protein ACHAXR_012253 [Thalassiosira sp. AJA248-18]
MNNLIHLKVAISIVIGFLGLFVFAVSIIDLLQKDNRDTELSILFTVSFIAILVFGSLTIIKFKYANNLASPSLYEDGICSLIGTCLSASLLLTTTIIEHSHEAWILDPIVSIIIGVSATVYGFRVAISMIQSGNLKDSYTSLP